MINSFQDGKWGLNTTNTLLEAELKMRKNNYFRLQSVPIVGVELTQTLHKVGNIVIPL